MKRLLAGAALAAPLVVSAHHGWSEYNTDKPLTLTGKVVQSGYEHPHGHIRLQAPGKSWDVVLAPPSRMKRRGVDQGALKPGASLTVQGYPNRDTPDEMRAERIIVDGKTIELK